VGSNLYTVTFNANGTVNVAGIVQGASIGVIVGDGATPSFDSVEYHHVDGSTFKLGDFGALFPSTAGAASFDFDLVLTDADGDTVDIPGGIVINLDADPNPPAMNLTAPAVQEEPAAALAEPVVTEDEEAVEPAVQMATDETDALIATSGDDVFAWELADLGTVGAPGTDTIQFFGSEGNDVLDLSDLLTDVKNNGTADGIGDLEEFLNVSLDGTDTVVSISSTGGFVDGVYDASAVDQTITLLDVDFGNDSAAAIKSMLDSGQLITD